MKEEPPKQLPVRTVETELTDREYAQCERSAARRGHNVERSGARQAAARRGRASRSRPVDEGILSEILALRKIVINLLWREKAGEPLSEERMLERIEAADSGVAPQSSERFP